MNALTEVLYYQHLKRLLYLPRHVIGQQGRCEALTQLGHYQSLKGLLYMPL